MKDVTHMQASFAPSLLVVRTCDIIRRTYLQKFGLEITGIEPMPLLGILLALEPSEPHWLVIYAAFSYICINSQLPCIPDIVISQATLYV